MRLFKRKNKQYSEADLISFGNYLLSNERTERISNHPDQGLKQHIQMRLQQVNHSDLHNWKDVKDKPKITKIDWSKYADDRI